MKTILLIIDMQQGFAQSPTMCQLANRIGQLIDSELFDSTIATRFLNSDYSVYESILGWKKLKTAEEQLLDSKIEESASIIFDKYIYNCVNENFIQKLRQVNEGRLPEKIYLVGSDTDCCILTSATALFEIGIRPIILLDYCWSNGGQQSHEAGITCMRRLIGENQLFRGTPKSRLELEEL